MNRPKMAVFNPLEDYRLIEPQPVADDLIDDPTDGATQQHIKDDRRPAAPPRPSDHNIQHIRIRIPDLVAVRHSNLQLVTARRHVGETDPVVGSVVDPVAGEILHNSDYKVDVHNPELMINITVREDYIYLFTDETLAAGGYPLGSGGKSLMMLSGGIDSPVAAYLMMKRGIKIECIHFASPPYTNEAVITKIKDLLKKLTAYQKEIKLFIVPFTKLQEEIYHHVNISYAITIMRRMMYRIASRVAEKRKDLVIANGESLGQVASQTLKSISVIEKVSTLPVIRPLAIFDKVDIIKIARKIDTYDISIRPYEDCCTIFEVKNPTTAPNEEKAIEYEQLFDFEKLIDDCVNNLEVLTITDEDEDDLL